MKIQIGIEQLEKIVASAKEKMLYDSSLSSTVEIDVVESCPTHTGSDVVMVLQKSSYAECNSSYLTTL